MYIFLPVLDHQKIYLILFTNLIVLEITNIEMLACGISLPRTHNNNIACLCITIELNTIIGL